MYLKNEVFAFKAQVTGIFKDHKDNGWSLKSSAIASRNPLWCFEDPLWKAGRNFSIRETMKEYMRLDHSLKGEV